MTRQRRVLVPVLVALLPVLGACRDATPSYDSDFEPAPRTTLRAPASTTSTTARNVDGGAARPSYTIAATLDLGANTVTGSVTVAFTPDLATDRLVFRLWPNGPTPAKYGGQIATGQAIVSERHVPSRLDGATTLVLDTGPLTAGGPLWASVPFTLTLPGPAPDRLARIGDAVRLGSWFPILAWEPGVGWATQPPTGGFAEASLSTAADFDVTFLTAPGLDVLASGVQDRPGHWTAKGVPDWAASVGHFTRATEMVGDVTVTVGVDSQVPEAPGQYLSVVTTALRQLAARYGAYPWPAYELAITPKLNGGIEYPGLVMQGPATDGRTTTHEVAHQWFYALVGSNQGRDPWLDEGLATWAEARVMGTLDKLRSRPIPAGGRGHMGEPMTFWESRQSIYYRSVYLQPLHALVALGVDAELIDQALADYVRANRHKVATPTALVNVLSRTAPHAPEVFARFGARTQ